MGDQAFIGRQPILDIKQKIIGYELFFRRNATAQSAVFEDNLKTCSQVLMNTVGEMDTQWLLGDKLAFINVNELMLKSDLLELMPPKHTILEVLQTVTPENNILERCIELRSLGYRIALDNPHLNLASEAFLGCADFVKIDMQAIDIDQAEKIFKQFHALSLKIVAEKIETLEQFELCKKSNVKFFQGYYFARPEALTVKVVNSSFDSVLNIMNTVSQDVDNKKIEAAFKLDSVLTFKLLRYINSVGFGLSCKIQSINHALMILGRKQLHRWLTLLLLSAGENSATPALIRTSITRGRLTELLGESYFEKNDCDNLFVIGIFSLLDKILKMPMDRILEKVQLPDTICEALLLREGIYGPFLQLTEACEDSDSTRILELAELLQLSSDKVNKSHFAALSWTEKMYI